MLSVLSDWLERTGAPGVSLSIDDGRETRCFTLGVSDIRTKTPVCEKTAFQMGSVSKVVTAFALVEALTERGLTVDTPVVDICPSLRASNEYVFHDVTVRHLLCHTSGLESQWWVDFGRGDGARRMAARVIASTPLLARPGELFSYAGQGLILAGYLTEVLSGQCWEEYVPATVAKYVGDHSIAARPEDILLRPSATGYASRSDADGPEAAARWYAPLALSPGGGLVGTTADMARLMRVVRKRLEIDLADEKTRFIMPTIGWRYDGWGLGVARYPLSDKAVCWGHDGTTSGEAYAVRLSEDRPETVVVATNAAWASLELGALAESILKSLQNISGSLPDKAGQDPLAAYPSWRLAPGGNITGCYARLNATVLVRSGSNDDIVVEEIYSPQDEVNWFGTSGKGEPRRVSDTASPVREHSYASASKEFHFLRHPDDTGRIYIHNGMRATLKTNRPWI